MIRFQERLTVSHKLMLISASLLLPLGVLLWFTIAEFNRVIHLAELERAGLELEAPLMALRDRTGRHQVLAHLRAAGVTGLESDLSREGDAISAAFGQLVTVHDRLGKELAAAGAPGSRGPDPKTLREDWNRLRGQVSRLDPAESDRRHEELRQAIRSLADQVANASQLVLDPELASFYLVDAAVVALPRLNDRLTSIEATAAPLLLHSVAQPRLVRRRLGEAAALLRESDLERIGTSLQAARQANPGLRVKDDAFASQFDPLLDQLGALANPEPAEALPIFARTEPAAPESPISEFDSALDRSRRAAMDLWGSAADELDRLLRARIERFQGRRLLALLLTGVALALSAGLIVGTGRSITRPLQRCVAGLQALADRDLRETIRVQAGGEVGAIAASLNLAIGNLRSLLGRIQLTSVSVMTGLNQFTANARQQQRLADDYRQATSETAVAINEITTTAQELLRGMNGVQALIAQTTDLAQSGQQALTALELSIRRLSQLTEALGVQLSATQGRAENIDLMVTTIIKVADETNLLSINAAIEAEKAGEHGRGFSVVAREIRRLADQTAVATLDIERTVAEMHQSLTTGASQMELVQEAVQSGVSELQQLSEQLSRIVTAVEDLEPEFQHVQDGMTMQSHGAEQIRDAMHRLSEQAHGSLNSLQEFNRATEQLREAIQELSQDVALFLLPGMTPRPAPASEPEPDPDQSDTGAPDDSEPFPPPPPPDLEPGAMPDFSTF